MVCSNKEVSLEENKYWEIILNRTKLALEKNGFEVSRHQTAKEAANYVVDTIIPETNSTIICRGDSSTVAGSGLKDLLKKYSSLTIIDHNNPNLSDEEWIEVHRETLLVDLFIASSNALTVDGALVNLDAVGNRVAAMIYGPKKIALLVGRNKIASNLEDARKRIKNKAAPINALRLNRKTPCAKTGYCMDCNSPDRICSVWSVIEKCYPLKRIHIALINNDLGY